MSDAPAILQSRLRAKTRRVGGVVLTQIPGGWRLPDGTPVAYDEGERLWVLPWHAAHRAGYRTLRAAIAVWLAREKRHADALRAEQEKGARCAGGGS